jgi:hypothetical protein
VLQHLEGRRVRKNEVSLVVMALMTLVRIVLVASPLTLYSSSDQPPEPFSRSSPPIRVSIR